MQVVNLSNYKFAIQIHSNRFKPLIQMSSNLILGLMVMRILQEALENQEVFEPSFEVKPNYEGEFIRAVKPVGFTSIKSIQYEPDPAYADKFILHPHPAIKFLTFTVYQVDKVIFQGDFSTDDVFRGVVETYLPTAINQYLAQEYEPPFYYEVITQNETTRNDSVSSGNKIMAVLSLSGLKNESVFEIPKLEKNREKLKFTKVIEEKLPVVEVDHFQKTRAMGKRGMPGRGRVILHQHVYDTLVNELELSRKDENGGYLLGNVFLQPESPEDESHQDFSWVVEITDVVKSSSTVGNEVLLMFTHDSWSEIKQKIDREYKDKKLVSWFHTHLFKATDDFGLSKLDQKLHSNFFSKPWQVALLLNIDKSGNRELRCFQMDTNKKSLVESTFEVIASA